MNTVYWTVVRVFLKLTAFLEILSSAMNHLWLKLAVQCACVSNFSAKKDFVFYSFKFFVFYQLKRILQ